MTTTGPPPPPARCGQRAVWEGESLRSRIVFLGRGFAPPMEPGEALARVSAEAYPVATVRQVHGARVVEARGPGAHGEADAVWTAVPGLAVGVVTADCVPVLIESGAAIAAVHAGWRGIAAGVVAEAVRALPAGPPRAWIGPAIGVCCYEVGEEVASRVAAASETDVVDRSRSRPHLDLPAAVRAQLLRFGCRTIDEVSSCTRCNPERLWSYRRDGRSAGRNLAFGCLRRSSGPAGPTGLTTTGCSSESRP